MARRRELGAARCAAGGQRARGADDRNSSDIRHGPKRKRKKKREKERGPAKRCNQEKTKSEGTTCTDMCTTGAVGQTRTKPRNMYERTSGSEERGSEASDATLSENAEGGPVGDMGEGGGDGVWNISTDGGTTTADSVQEAHGKEVAEFRMHEKSAPRHRMTEDQGERRKHPRKQ